MKARAKKTTSDGFEYLTKRKLVSEAQRAGRIAAKKAMEIMGFVVTVQDGWVVKRYEDGKTEQLHQLE